MRTHMQAIRQAAQQVHGAKRAEVNRRTAPPPPPGPAAAAEAAAAAITSGSGAASGARSVPSDGDSRSTLAAYGCTVYDRPAAAAAAAAVPSPRDAWPPAGPTPAAAAASDPPSPSASAPAPVPAPAPCPPPCGASFCSFWGGDGSLPSWPAIRLARRVMGSSTNSGRP
ncbi:hypothetical protein TSOC_004353 [Tetrabaena socialis]|uniref:Uncharacterized protein n=1 Tax=Tetrabaena socialis TaxID=47790 RepID=A0A2J8A920_9CHLO|nr:hypothetical protein TSOC_004353 [Tetrabaena socialis]|eukprot:PNH09027.1 hypothetical protein TSOC_004353 [Tetrabaena socialis]